MRRGRTPAIGAALLLVGALTAARLEPIGPARDPAPIVFVCRNGVAMSVWSAAYFNRLAEERGLRERAAARASIPSYSAVPFSMAVALALDGFRLGGYVPRVIDARDARHAALVVAIDTELPRDVRATASRVDVWAGFPPMREQYFPSRAALKLEVAELVARLAARAEPSPAAAEPRAAD
ncbi:MAG TPA: hypothetical protein VFT98_21575 [Myxococcota bacterium]|nr:hypothetical protein [Myxococcota bacterium]